MLKNKRRVTGWFGLLTVAAVLATLLPGGAAQADESGAKFVAQSRAAGLSADKAATLQADADRLLEKLGSGATQVAPNKIKMPGAELILPVPGQEQRPAPCPYYNFCAYSEAGFTGYQVNAEDCAITYGIPWYTYNGSWINNQTPGRRARVNYTDGTHWYVPGAYSQQSSNMGWYRVGSVDPC
ncbi:hypothetical protein ACQEVC_42835 [Plantactinospora sp. CA-294935]|uniref:hypothetical protein n=1 Tax=Plantactinospora sp. CA-294935 TaxID=3240012 RepID=UPI003D919036